MCEYANTAICITIELAAKNSEPYFSILQVEIFFVNLLLKSWAQNPYYCLLNTQNNDQ
jgi:hypothetical protein